MSQEGNDFDADAYRSEMQNESTEHLENTVDTLLETRQNNDETSETREKKIRIAGNILIDRSLQLTK